MAKSEKNKAPNPVLAENRKARHDYQILEALEAGVDLAGTEVKSCRARQIVMADAYVAIEAGEAWLYNTHISQYSHGNRFNHDAKQKRRLLLHKKEILRFHQQTREKGLTIVPLKFYLKGGLVKVEIALARGKTFGDKRETLRERQDNLEAKKMMSHKR